MPLGLENGCSPVRPGVPDEAHAVAISPAVATMTSAPPELNRRGRPVSCCGVRSMTHLRSQNVETTRMHVPLLGRTGERVARNVRVPVHKRAGRVFFPRPHVKRVEPRQPKPVRRLELL